MVYKDKTYYKILKLSKNFIDTIKAYIIIFDGTKIHI